VIQYNELMLERLRDPASRAVYQIALTRYRVSTSRWLPRQTAGVW